MAAIATGIARKTPRPLRADERRDRPRLSLVHVAAVSREEESDDFDRVMGSPFVFKPDLSRKPGIGH